jgi:hypothetical protein
VEKLAYEARAACKNFPRAFFNPPLLLWITIMTVVLALAQWLGMVVMFDGSPWQRMALGLVPGAIYLLCGLLACIIVWRVQPRRYAALFSIALAVVFLVEVALFLFSMMILLMPDDLSS